MRITNRRKLSGLFLVLATLLTGCVQKPVVFKTLDGETYTFDEFEGQWVVVNYWAIWCGPCRKEIPELNELNHRDDVVVIGVDWDASPVDKTAEYAQAMGIEFTTSIDDPAGFLGQDKPNLLPTTFIINPEGKVINVLKGGQTFESIVDNFQ